MTSHPTPPTPERVERIRNRHQRCPDKTFPHQCVGYVNPWPGCESADLLAALDSARSRVEALEGERDKLLKLARHKSGCYSERNFERECDCGLWEMREAARKRAAAALKASEPQPRVQTERERAAAIAREHAEDCAGGCGDVIARKIEGGP